MHKSMQGDPKFEARSTRERSMAITQMNQIYKVLMDPGSRFLQVITHNYVLHNQITNRNEGGGRLSVKIQIFDLNQSSIEYEIIGEGSQISTNQKRESTVSWLLIGRNL